MGILKETEIFVLALVVCVWVSKIILEKED
jgi:hypothetical protein